MCRDRPEDHLHEDEERHDPDVLRRGAHRGRRLHTTQRIRGGQDAYLVFLRLSIVVDEDTDAGQQHQHAEARPEVERRGSDIADRGVVRPVVGIADIRTWAVGDADPRSPSEEGAHLLHLAGIFDALSAQGVGRAELDELRRIVAEEELRVVGTQLVGDLSTQRRVRDDARRFVEGVLTHLLTQEDLILSLLSGRE